MAVAVVLIALVVLGLVGAFALAVPLAIRSLAKDEKGRKTALENEGQILDGLFDGAPDVTYEVSARTLPYERVIIGAKDRGYRLLSETTNPGNRKMLVFTTDRPGT